MVISSGASGKYIPAYTNTPNSKGRPYYTHHNTNMINESLTQSSNQPLKEIIIDVNQLQQIPINAQDTIKNRSNLMNRRTEIVAGILLLYLFFPAIVPALIYSLKINNVNNSSSLDITSTTVTTQTTTTATTSTSTNTSTTTSSISTITTTTTTATSSTSTTTSTTTTVPPSTVCSTSTSNAILYNNQFIYSPTHQLYAAGMLNNQFGVYNAYGYGNVTSTLIWTCPQTALLANSFFAAQQDRNLVVYGGSGTVVWASATGATPYASYCLQILDNGNLIWTNSTNTIIWQTNSTVVSG